MMRAILFSLDLLGSSKISAAALRQGATLSKVGGQAALLSQARDDSAELVILDLETRGTDWPALIAALRQIEPSPRVIAFGPHVQEAILQMARDAGADLVLTRGQLHAQIDALLSRDPS